MADDIKPDETPTPETPPLKYPDVKFPSLEIRCQCLEALRLGLGLDQAAEACGYSASTVRKWMGNWPEFKAQVEAARSQGKINLLKDIRAAGEKKDWRAAKFLLETQWPGEFGETNKFSIKDFEGFIQAIADRLRAKLPEAQHEIVKEALLEAMEGYRDGSD